ncbi:MAG: DNA mismatch repair endonuclease MutL [Polyangiaceae bacterium]|nr:DNA mismatch repair endonuclease MutL [Polyangiaceae bacterium]
MGHILVLPSDLANQIAAGEVVERPASVVKELVENAIDAGATRIRVDIERGGTDLVRVTDDGQGMDASDAVLALERHATSKIRNKDDLFAIHTFGFRGEALPSIASVSRLRLTTRARGAPEGTEVSVEGGRARAARPTGSAEGTTVEVRDLFFNVPARRKFLKSIGTEAAHVADAVLMSALGRPDVSFFLHRDGRLAREWLRVGERGERAARALDGETLRRCLGERGPVRIEAHLAAPERARAGTVGLHLFVNGRAVRDRTLARAVAQAYGSVLEPGRYPVGVVYVDLPANLVDVNVHPQKAEVRFADGRALFDAVSKELHAALARAFSVPVAGAQRTWPVPPSPANAPTAPTRIAEVFEASDPWQLASPARPAPIEDGAEVSTMPSPPYAEAGCPALFEGAGFYGSLVFLAQVRSTFLVCDGGDGIYILDQHAAAERVTFHRLRTGFLARALATQRLLLPEPVELSAAQMAVLDEQADRVAAFGVEVRAIGPSAVAVHTVPALLSRMRPDRIVLDILAELGHTAKRPHGDAADRVLATMACHGSVRAGDVLAREEVTALLRALDGVDFGGHCPHGRPVVTRLGYDELERRVGR